MYIRKYTYVFVYVCVHVCVCAFVYSWKFPSSTKKGMISGHETYVLLLMFILAVQYTQHKISHAFNHSEEEEEEEVILFLVVQRTFHRAPYKF